MHTEKCKITGFKVEIGSKNNDWKNIFYGWISINREYIEDSNFKDCMYWYNERACVGTLCGAIWKKGGVCLEEYSSIKATFDKEKPKEFLGRTDLFFYLGNHNYLVEAKYVSGLSGLTNKIDSQLKKAKEDCEKSIHYEPKEVKAIALVFIVPYETKEKSINLIEFEKKLKERSDLDFYCSFENKTKDNIEADNGNICNSCYIIGKEVSRKLL